MSQPNDHALSRPGELRKSIDSDLESSPGLLLRFAAMDWTIILIAWSAMALLDSAFAMIGGILIVASRLQALGAILHDACHSRARSNAWPFVEAVAGWPIASTIPAMRYHHLRHHRYSGTAADPYRNAWINRGAPERLALTLRGVLLPFWWTLRAVVAPAAWHWAPIRRFYTRAFLQDRAPEDCSDSAEVRECIKADFRQLIAQLSFLTIATLAALPLAEFYLVPWMLAGTMNARRVIYEHAFEESADSSRWTVFEATKDHQSSAIVGALLYPHNLGYHRAHHLYPTAAFVHLPKLTRQVEAARDNA